MGREETLHRDSQEPLGPREGDAVRFAGVEACGEQREADSRQVEQSEREYAVPVGPTRSRKRRAVEPPVEEDKPRRSVGAGPSTFNGPYALEDEYYGLNTRKYMVPSETFTFRTGTGTGSRRQRRDGNKPTYQPQRSPLGRSE